MLPSDKKISCKRSTTSTPSGSLVTTHRLSLYPQHAAGSLPRPPAPTTAASSSRKPLLKREPPATTTMAALFPQQPPAKKWASALVSSATPTGCSPAGDRGSSASLPLSIPGPWNGAPAARPPATAAVAAAVGSGGSAVGDRRNGGRPIAAGGAASEARAKSNGFGSAVGAAGVSCVVDVGNSDIDDDDVIVVDVNVGGSVANGVVSDGIADGAIGGGDAVVVIDAIDVLSPKEEEPDAPCIGTGGAGRLQPEKADDVVMVSADDDLKPAADDDDDADLMVPVELGTSKSDHTSEVAEAEAGVKKDAYFINGELHSHPPMYSIDELVERHKEREKARLEREAAQERLKSGGLQGLLCSEEQKDVRLASGLAEDSDNHNILSEEQREMALQMSVPASVLKDKHPGHRFCDARLQQSLFSEINCHVFFEPESSAVGSRTVSTSRDSTTPLGLYPRAVEHMMSLRQLHLLLQLCPNKQIGLDYAFCLMSCHSTSAVVQGIKGSLLELLKSPLPGTGRCNTDIAGSWFPTAPLILGVLMNFGADLITSFSLDDALAAPLRTCKEAVAESLPRKARTNSCSSRSTDGESIDVSSESQWPTADHVRAVLSVVASVARTRAVYSDNEIETMLLSVILLALDEQFTEWHIDFELCYFVGAMLRALSKSEWQEKASNIARKLAVLLAGCHHHTRLRAVEWFTFNEADVIPFVRCRLAYALLSQLLFDAVEFDDIDHLKVKMLINIEQSILLPSRGRDVDLYLTATLLQLLFHSVNLYSLDKAELADLHQINTSMKERERKIRFSFRVPDVMEIKHQILLMTSMWAEALPSFENQQVVFYGQADTDHDQQPLSIEKVNAYEEAEDDSDGYLPSPISVDSDDL